MEEKAKEIAELLKMLANENRLMILCYLLKVPMNVSELNEKISNISQSALSQHLSLLKANRILDSSKSGQNITYYIKDERIRLVIEVLKENYCQTN